MTYKINYDSRDPFGVYGMQHFESKYKIGLVQSEKDVAQIEVAVNRIAQGVVNRVRTDYGMVPFFEDLEGKDPVEERDGKIFINFDLFNEVGCILSGHLETIDPDERKKLAMVPLVDIYEKMLMDAINSTAEGSESKPAPLWPDGKGFALCLTHDVDEIRKTYQYLTRPAIHVKRGEFSRALTHAGSLLSDPLTGKRPYWTFEDMMALEERLGVRSTFYFLQEDGPVELSKPGTFKLYARRYRFAEPGVTKVMKELQSGGWEVGLHGSYYSYQSAEKLSNEKKELESALGTKVTGTRQHHLNLNIPDTWKYQASAGIEYDASLGFKDDAGFRWGTCFPFHPLDASTGTALPLLELPLIVMDTTFFAGKKDPWEKIERLVSEVERQGGLLTVLFHHAVFNQREYPGWSETYEKLINLCKEKNAWIARGTDVNDWWRAR